MTIKPAIDCMGGNHGVGVTIPAATHFLAAHEDVEILLVGQPDAITAQLRRLHATASPRVHVIPASEVVSMGDPIGVASRKKKDSSMRMAINQFKEGAAQTYVSTGSTGTLMAVSRYVLKTLGGIDRPAIATAIPNKKGASTTVLDLGANADYEPEHLLQFAQMTSAMVSVVKQKPRPTVGLLNIGERVIKNNEVVKQTNELLRTSNLNFFSNVEDNDISRDTTDIVVCDGFIDDMTLESTEGLTKMVGGMLRQKFSRSWFIKLLAVVVLPMLTRFKRRMDYQRYNGAALLGPRGLVIKSHGLADAYTFEWVIKCAYDATADDVIARIAQAFESHRDAAGAVSASTSAPAADAT